jgi:hypothetical protein
VTEDFEMDATQTDDSSISEKSTRASGADAGRRAAGEDGDRLGGDAASQAGSADDGGETTPTIDGLVAQWRSELDGQTSIPATDVQDRLLDLWGALPENQARAEVERWLTETLARHLYQVEDITSRLDNVLSDR